MTKEIPTANDEKPPQTICFQNSGFGILSSFDICHSDFLMHLDLAGSDATTKEVELRVGMVRQQGHRDGRVRDALRNQQCREALSERIVMPARVRDRRLP